MCFYGDAAERILELTKTDLDPKCHSKKCISWNKKKTRIKWNVTYIASFAILFS